MSPLHTNRSSRLLLELFVVCIGAVGIVRAQLPHLDDSYFPLVLGARWHYSDDASYDFSRTIADTATHNGHLYFKVTWSIVGDPWTRHEWFRKENDTVFVILDDLSNAEHPLYCIGLFVPYPWNSNTGCTYGNSIDLSTRNDTVDLGSEVLTQCYAYNHSGHPCADAGIFATWLAKGIGLVKIRFNTIAGWTDVPLKTLVVTSVTDEPMSSPEMGFELFPNYPNPFNSSTTIRYKLRAADFVTVEIVDFLGRRVRLLVSEHQQAGTWSVRWEAVGVTSGIYFARLSNSRLTSSQKVLLLR